MKLSFDSDISVWFFPLCVIVSLTITTLLYYKRNVNNELAQWKKASLIGLRFLSTLMLTMLLLNIVFKKQLSILNKPIIVLGQDNSESIILRSDSLFNIDDYKLKFNQFKKDLAVDFTVENVAFGAKISDEHTFSFTDKLTDLGQYFDLFQSKFLNKHVVASIVFTDGIINHGTEPLKKVSNLPFPVFFCALGDTTVPFDIAIDQVLSNSKVYKGNVFPICVNVIAKECKGSTTLIRLMLGGKQLASKKLDVVDNDFFEKVVFNVLAEKEGALAYNIVIDELTNENNVVNNTRKIIVNVSDEKQKILFLQDGYHPDASAFNQALSNQPAFDLQIENTHTFDGALDEFDLFILNQMPSQQNVGNKLLKKIFTSGKPVLFILGEQSNIASINNLNKGLSIEQSKALNDDVFGVINNDFGLFKLAQSNELMRGFPPLRVPFGRYNIPIPDYTLMYQKVGNTITQNPLIYFTDDLNSKTGFIVGEGIWRWRIYDFQLNKNHQFIDGIILKTIQYLLQNETKEPFVVDYKIKVNEGDNIRFEARLLNPSNELVNSEPIDFKIIDKQNNEFPYNFSTINNYYQLDIGSLVSGRYRFVAQTKWGDHNYKKSGQFVVVNQNIEALNLTANHNLLYQLADQSGGKVFYLNTIDQFTKEVISKIENKPSYAVSTKYLDALSMVWLFAIIMFFILLEWFLRKYWGGV